MQTCNLRVKFHNEAVCCGSAQGRGEGIERLSANFLSALFEILKKAENFSSPSTLGLKIGGPTKRNSNKAQSVSDLFFVFR